MIYPLTFFLCVVKLVIIVIFVMYLTDVLLDNFKRGRPRAYATFHILAKALSLTACVSELQNMYLENLKTSSDQNNPICAQ